MNIKRVHYNKFVGRLFGSNKPTAEDAIRFKKEIQLKPNSFSTWVISTLAEICERKKFQYPYDIVTIESSKVTPELISDCVSIKNIIEFESKKDGWLIQVQFTDKSEDKKIINNYDELDVNMNPKTRQIWDAFGYNN